MGEVAAGTTISESSWANNPNWWRVIFDFAKEKNKHYIFRHTKVQEVDSSMMDTILKTSKKSSTSKKEKHNHNERESVTEPHLTKILFKNICKVQSRAVNKRANLNNMTIYIYKINEVTKILTKQLEIAKLGAELVSLST